MAAQDAHAEATLHEETLSELGLTEQPFQEDKKRQRFTDSTTQRSRAALEQHLRFGDAMHLLIGDDGAGKTVLLSQLIKHCKGSIKPFVVKGSADFEAEAFLAAVLHQLDNQDQAESVSEHIEKLTPLFEQINNDQYSVVLVVDDAHLAPFEEIAELVDITQQFENSDGRTARLLLTGTPALKQSITKIEDQFEDLDLKYSTNQLPLYDDGRVRQYLTSRLHQAGHADAFPFTDKAITKIQRDSGGLPGKINTNATHYLNGVYRGGAAAAPEKAGWLGALGWPVLLTGAAAIGAIGWGISMFFGDKPNTQTPVADVRVLDTPLATDGTEVVVATPSAESTDLMPSTTIDGNASTTDLIGTEQIAAPSESNTLVATPSATDLVLPEEPTADITTALNEAEAVIVQPQVSQPLVTEQELAITESVPLEQVVEQVIPKALNNEDTAASKSVANTVANTPVPESVEVPVGQLTQSDNSINTGALQNNTDTDAASVNSEELLGSSSTGDADAVGVNVDLPAQNRAIENERWVLFQSPAKFTVQLATSKERNYIIDLAQTMAVRDPVAIYPFLTTNSQNPVYGLLSGLYDTRAEALAAVENMSTDSKRFGTWIRPVSDLQEAIKNRR